MVQHAPQARAVTAALCDAERDERRALEAKRSHLGWRAPHGGDECAALGCSGERATVTLGDLDMPARVGERIVQDAPAYRDRFIVNLIPVRPAAVSGRQGDMV